MSDTPAPPLDAPLSARSLLPRYLGVSLAMWLVGGALTGAGMDSWYDELVIPAWQPDGVWFAPVWGVLLTLLAFATADVMSGPETPLRARATALYWIQVILNVLWSAAFFTSHSPEAALIVIKALIVVLIWQTLTYRRLSTAAAWKLVPYLLWVLFASAINLWIVVHN